MIPVETGSWESVNGTAQEKKSEAAMPKGEVFIEPKDYGRSSSTA